MRLENSVLLCLLLVFLFHQSVKAENEAEVAVETQERDSDIELEDNAEESIFKRSKRAASKSANNKPAVPGNKPSAGAKGPKVLPKGPAPKVPGPNGSVDKGPKATSDKPKDVPKGQGDKGPKDGQIGPGDKTPNNGSTSLGDKEPSKEQEAPKDKEVSVNEPVNSDTVVPENQNGSEDQRLKEEPKGQDKVPNGESNGPEDTRLNDGPKAHADQKPNRLPGSLQNPYGDKHISGHEPERPLNKRQKGNRNIGPGGRPKSPGYHGQTYGPKGKANNGPRGNTKVSKVKGQKHWPKRPADKGINQRPNDPADKGVTDRPKEPEDKKPKQVPPKAPEDNEPKHVPTKRPEDKEPKYVPPKAPEDKEPKHVSTKRPEVKKPKSVPTKRPKVKKPKYVPTKRLTAKEPFKKPQGRAFPIDDEPEESDTEEEELCEEPEYSDTAGPPRHPLNKERSAKPKADSGSEESDETIQCKSFKGEPCQCFQNGCNFDFDNKRCTVSANAHEEVCRRYGANYAISPTDICSSIISTEMCSNSQSYFGINFNGNDYIDSHGRKYIAEKSISEVWDPKQIRAGGIAREASCKLNIAAKDRDKLYLKYIWGECTKGNEEACMSYPILFQQGGDYELTIKSLYGLHGKTSFDIKFNNVLIATDIDLSKFTGPGKCGVVDIVFLFHVSADMRLLTLYDRQKSLRINKGFHLFFCLGSSSKKDVGNTFYISALSLMRFGDDTKAPAQIKEIKTACNRFSNNPCSCELNNCFYNSAKKKCQSKKDSSASNHQSNDKLVCRRSQIHYVYAPDRICKSYKNTGKCEKSKATYGLNLNGEEHIDANGIRYLAEKFGMAYNPRKLRKATQLYGKCKVEKVNENDSNDLYGTFIYGDAKSSKKGVCLSYSLPMVQDGEYELVIKAFEPFHTEPGRRLYDIKLNGRDIAENIDLVRLGEGRKCVAIDISIQFQVDKGVRRLRRMNMKDLNLNNNSINVGFCNSKNNVVDGGFQASALYLLRYGEGTVIPKEYKKEECQNGGAKEGADGCHGESNDGIVKVIQNWKINSGSSGGGNGGSKGRTTPIPKNRCHRYNNDIPCRRNGCEFDLATNKCLPEMKDCHDDFFKDYTDCRRFPTGTNNCTAIYASAGVLCVNRKNRNNKCFEAEQMFGVNFGGNKFSGQKYDWRNTVYNKDDYESEEDQEGIRIERSVVTKDACTLSKFNDPFFKPLLGRVVTANMDMVNEGQQACVPYYFKVCGDGVYELSLLVLEGTSDACFDIKIGDTTVLRSVDPYRIAGRQCARLELLVLFKVQNDNTEIVPKGFTEPIIIDYEDKIPLNLCTGSCGAPDQSFQLSAASVHRLSLTNPDGDTCQ